MTDIERIREWLGTYSGYDILGNFRVDYTDQIPANGGIFPSGLVVVARKTDIFGAVTVKNQYNFGLYYVFTKADDDTAKFNADWIMDFQMWIQEQSATCKAPTFGDEPWNESIQAQNGVLYDADGEGLATYMVQLSVNFTKHY